MDDYCNECGTPGNSSSLIRDDEGRSTCAWCMLTTHPDTEFCRTHKLLMNPRWV